MAREPRGRHPLLAYLPIGIVLVIVAVAGFRIWMYHWRQGAALIAGALFVAAALRTVLTNEQAGLLAIRGRAVDILTYGGMGALIFFVAVTIGDGPFS